MTSISEIQSFRAELGADPNTDTTSNISDVEKRFMAMVAIFGPSIASAAVRNQYDQLYGPKQPDAPNYTRGKEDYPEDMEAHEALTNAVHDALSAIILREHPEAAERAGLMHALEEFDNEDGMRDGFPLPAIYHIGRGSPSYEEQQAAMLRDQLSQHRQGMADSRYTVPFGDALRAAIPYVDAADLETYQIFKEVFPHSRDRAFGEIWSMLLKQDSHVERFSWIMGHMHETGDTRKEPKVHTMPEKPADRTDYSELGNPDRIYKLNYIMTEADVRRIFSEPIARAFSENFEKNGELKDEFLRGGVLTDPLNP